MNSVACPPVMAPAVLLGVCARETLPPAPAGMTCSTRSANSDTMRAGHKLFITPSADHQPPPRVGGELKSGF
jgi:hypothetical protein